MLLPNQDKEWAKLTVMGVLSLVACFHALGFFVAMVLGSWESTCIFGALLLLTCFGIRSVHRSTE